MLKGIRAFTLIELLIVMAIIGILAAIAVPNYNDALVRSKGAKFKGDCQALQTAVESYRADHNYYAFPEGYPPGSTCDTRGNMLPGAPGTGYLPRCLTTPAPYLGKLPNDPFPNLEDRGPCFPERRTYLYSADDLNWIRWRQCYVSILCAQVKAQGVYAINQQRPTNAIWMISSVGPDSHRDQGPSSGGFPRSPYTVSYDPTNGTQSGGDLFMFGPSIGFGDNL